MSNSDNCAELRKTVETLLKAIDAMPETEGRWARAEEAADRHNRGVSEGVMQHANRGHGEEFLAEVRRMLISDRQPWRELADRLLIKRDQLRGTIAKLVPLVAAAPALVARGSHTHLLFELIEFFVPEYPVPTDPIRRAKSLMLELQSAIQLPYLKTLSPKHAAKRLNVTEPHVYRLIKNGKLHTLAGTKNVVESSVDDYFQKTQPQKKRNIKSPKTKATRNNKEFLKTLE